MPIVQMVKAVPEQVEAARRQRLLGVGELARRARVSGKTIWFFRTGQPVGIEKARAIARILRVGLEALVEQSGGGGGGHLESVVREDGAVNDG